jgi:substrate import-associated zinc metallohydrolase lipoprotein
MTLKNILHTGLCGLLLISAASCRKSSALDVDMSKYIVDNPATTDLDNWITDNLTNPYNIQLQYRYERDLLGDVGKDVSPVKLDKVQPTAQAIINIFLKTYEKVAGVAFIKTYTPKQFVLFGSPAYNSDGSLTLGSADGGRRVILYDLNNLDFTNPAQVSTKMLTIHHEFTHILNQSIAIPPDFLLVTKSDYMVDWTNGTNTDAVAKSLGFVSRYARQDYNEDFAETVAALLIKGQLWFDSYAKLAGADGQTKLKKKEALVVDYFKQYFNINFRDLQYEVGKVLRVTYNDKTRGFMYAWQNNLLANPLVVDFNQPHYAQFGQSAKFQTVWNNVKAGLATVGYTPVSFNVVFVSPTVIQLQHTLANTAGAAVAWYDYNIAINANGEISFTKFDNGSTAREYVNGRTALPAFTPLNNYLATKLFKADWMPAAATDGGSNYLKFAGFYVSNEPDNYFYGKF